MVVCKFFAQGQCRYGNNCRFYHPYRGAAPAPVMELPTLLAAIANEMRQWQASGQWPLSCFAPLQGGAPVPGLVDWSPEELRLHYTLCCRQPQPQPLQHEHHCRQLLEAAAAARAALCQPGPELRAFLQRQLEATAEAKAGDGTSLFGARAAAAPASAGGSANSVFTASGNCAAPNSVFAAAGGNCSVFRDTANMAPSAVFAGSVNNRVSSAFVSAGNNTTGSVFGAAGTNSAGPVPAGSASLAGISVFGGSSSATKGSVFDGLAATGNASLFPGAATQPAGLLLPDRPNSAFAASDSSNGSLFGGSRVSTASVFGNSAATSQPVSQSVFGNSAATSQPVSQSVFGNSAATTQPVSQSVFGNSAATSQPVSQSVSQSQTLSASASHSASENTLAGGSPRVGGSAAALSCASDSELFGRRGNISVPAPNMFPDCFYSTADSLSQQQLAAFQADRFDLSSLPRVPPPRELCF